LSGKSFQVGETTTGTARLATVVNLTKGTAKRLELAERSGRRPDRSAT